MGILAYYVNLGYSVEDARALANPPVSRPNRCRARWWFKPGRTVQNVPDKLLQQGTRAKVGRKPVYFEPPKLPYRSAKRG